MRPFALMLLTVAAVHANMGYSSAPATAPQGYAMNEQRTSTYGGASSDSGVYGGGQTRTAPVETVRISYGSGDAAGYSAPAHDSSAGYGGSQSDSSVYGGSQRAAQNVETVRVAYNSHSGDNGYATPTNTGGYGGQSQSTPSVSTYGGSSQSDSSYGGSQRAAQNVETVRVSYNSNSGDSGYEAPASAGGYSQSSSSLYGGSQSDSSSYGGSQRTAQNVETVRVSYGSGDAGYSAQSTEAAAYGGSQNTQPMSSYGGAQQTEAYGGNQQRAQNIETVRVSYNSNSGDSGYATPNAAPAYGSQSAPAAPAYGSQSAPAAPAYGSQSAPAAASYGSSQQDMSTYGGSQRVAQNVETVRVAYNSGSSDSGSSYGSPSNTYSAPAAPQVSSYGSSNNDASSSYGHTSSSYGGASSTRNTVPILRHNQVITPGSSHQYDFATGDGISHSETTSVRGSSGGAYGGSSSSEVVKQGQFSYTSPEGQAISLTYQADGQGFRAQGDHLPTSPPIPAEIAKSLRTNAYASSSNGGYSSSSQSSAY